MGILKKLRNFVTPSKHTSELPTHSVSKSDPKFTETSSSATIAKNPDQALALEPYTDPKDVQGSLNPIAEDEWELYTSDQYQENHKFDEQIDVYDEDHSAYDHLALMPDYLDSDSALPEYEIKSNQELLGLPETEKVSAILPPEVSNDMDPFGASSTPESTYHQETSNVFISSSLRVGAQAAPRLSLALVPVAIPSPMSHALIYREQIFHLRNYTETESDQEKLLQLFTDYTELVPNDVEMWNDYSNLLIELRGLEFAYQQIQKALGKTRDDTAHLLMLADLSRRMCDHHAAWHYISILNELHPNNIEVLERLRDIQKECKFFELAQHTDEHIRQLHQQNHKSDEYNFPLENMD